MTRRLSPQNLVSMVALAAGLVATQTHAAPKAFLGNYSTAFGDVFISEGTDVTNILVNSTSAVIDWTPDDNVTNNGVPILFLDGTGTATFQGFSDFAVLNRIQVADNSRQILLNGTINSLINESPGGKIFFYSPSGFLVGSNAAINVGSLVLSASPIAVDGSGNFISGTTVTFNQAPNTAAAIATAAGSQINAYGSGSYVALVAPQITHSGTIRTDTAAALVAAEAATITFSPDGLYNIQVTNGTDAATGIDIDGGTITRNDPTEGGGNHRAYLVAVARNDAVAMLIRNGGSVGFDTATSALVEDNVVVLSGGYDVNGTPNIPSGTSTVGLTIDNATFSSDTVAVVSGGATITTSTGSTAFGNNLDLFAGDDSFIQAINGNTLSFGGTVFASVDTFGTGPQTNGNLLRFGANANSALTVGGNVFLSAQSFGAGASVDGTNAGNATGGSVIVQTGSGSTIDITGTLDINVDGYGGSHGAFNGAAGNGTGGIGHILANGGSGSAITVGGAVNVSAIGRGGTTGECSSCQITGGTGTGGTILLQAAVGAGNLLSLNSDVTLYATGFGGAGDVVGGSGGGGTIQFQSNDLGTITIVGDLLADVSGEGGFGLDNGVSGGTGGAATGGYASILFSGPASTIHLLGSSIFSANAFGGGGVNGGAATGGWVNLQASSNGDLNADFLGASADAFGGSGDVGGTALGGRAWVQAVAGGAIVVNDLSLSAEGFAGQSDFENGASGTGGYVIASASNATLTVNNSLDLEADGRGGFADADGTTGGIGTGGQADVFADNGGTVTLSGAVALDANGRGGNYISDLATGGNGTGGLVFFQASNGASLTAASNVVLTANGYGGFSFGDCNFCGGTGGNGTGGTVTVQTYGGAETSIGVGGVLSLDANGFGSSGFAGAGGNGLGGTARVVIAESGTLDVTSDLIVTADGQGGIQDNGGLAGNGTGGFAEVTTGTGINAIGVGGTGTVSASGLGGNASGNGSIGGNGRGGFARILSLGGLANFLSDVDVRANGSGGTGTGGNGGDGTAGQARLVANGGDISVAADLGIEAISIGGDGNFGGNAITFIGNDPQNTATSDARLLATNGDVIVSGATLLDVSAQGGNGANGGDGGNASAAFAAVHARNSNLGPSSITLGSVTVDANGYGGGGGAGVFGDPGGNGGNGGSATGGFIVITGSAGNGTLDLGDVIASASAFGGDGGGGGSSEILAGGNGGNGGSAEGGFLNIGTESGIAQATGANDGGATFASITALANAVGGDGGGISFGNPVGLVGDGGDAHGGQSFLLVRGSPVIVGNVLLDATATGGDGGFDQFENFGGIGGTATSGQVGVLATNRLNFALQRGSLTAGNIVGFANALGGGGAVNGLAGSSGGLLFNVVNSDATIASVNLSGSADFFDPASPIAGPSQIGIQNGDVTITGGFSVITPGEISMWADSATLDAAAITVSADNFIHDPSLPVGFVPGTYSAGAFSLTTGQDLIIDAHLSTPSSITLSAPGLVEVMNVSSGGSVFGNAGTDFTAGDIDAFDGIQILAGGDINLGNLSAGFSFLEFGNDAIELDAGGSILLGDATALGRIDFSAGATVTGGNLTSGLSIGGDAEGAILLGDLSAGLVNPQGPDDEGFSIGIASATSVTVGDVAGLEAVGFATLGALTTGDVNAGTDFLAMVSGDMSFGSITAGPTGRTYLADASMFIAAGGVDDFDPNLVFPFAPVPTLGSITIGGPVSTGSFQAAAGTSFGSGAITAGSTIFIRSGSSTTTGNLGAGTNVDIASSGGAITTGSINANTGILLSALGGITTGAMTTGNFIDARSGGSILTGNLITVSGDIFLLADGNITTGTVTAASDADFDSLGNVTLGVVNVGGLLFVDAGGNLALASAQAGTFIDLLAGGTLIGGNLTAGQSILARSNGALSLGNLSAGIVNPSGAAGSHVVGIGSNTSVQVGNVNGADFVGLTSAGALTAGAVQSGGDIIALVNGPATIASIANPQGRTYIAGFGMLAVGGGFDNFDPALVYAAANPIPSTGSVTISGSTNTGRLDAFVGGNFTAGLVTAGAINARVGGLATLTGLWQAPDVDLWSNDIDIGAGAGIDAGNTGDITLVSTNATQALIGDGLTGTGYQLSNAEFGRLSSGSLAIAARGDASAAIDMVIGNLTITGPLAGSTIDDPNGSVLFFSGNPGGEIPGGVIRVTGNVAATGFTDTNALEFYADRFELDAATGSISILSSGTTLGGELGLYADQIHVAEGSILDQLAVDPQYAGYQDDLNAPAAVQRPAGVLNASVIWIESDNLQNILIQNTGTEELPAGFLANEIFVNDDFEVAGPPGSIDVVVNGQLQTEAGALTGIDVRDALVEGEDLSPFTDNSTINGCLLTGPCEAESPFPPGFTPVPGIQQEIVLIERNLLPPPDFGNEDFIDDNNEATEDGATSPIQPPQPLFDTSALGDQGDVDDPVSGSGNPALMETPPPPSNQEQQP